ncbi:hypothetical protein [Mycobacterium antarcticum]
MTEGGDQYPTDPQRDQYTADPQRPDASADPLAAPTQATQPDAGRAPTPGSHAYASAPEEHARVVDPSTTSAQRSSADHAGNAHSAAGGSSEESLFASADLTGLRSRWDDVQAGFVDDPRQCVQTADGLVSDVVQQLTDGFSEARSRLEQQWARGEDVSTEDLRLALKRYREFFDRLLAV